MCGYEHARAHGSEEAATSTAATSTAALLPELARVKPFINLLLGSPRLRTDFRPSRARLWPLRQAPISNPCPPLDAQLARADHY